MKQIGVYSYIPPAARMVSLKMPIAAKLAVSCCNWRPSLSALARTKSMKRGIVLVGLAAFL